jgi:hypothetical protein
MKIEIDIPDSIVPYLERFVKQSTKPPYVDENGNMVIEPMFRRGIPEFIEEILATNFEQYIPPDDPYRVAYMKVVADAQKQMRDSVRPNCRCLHPAGGHGTQNS